MGFYRKKPVVIEARQVSEPAAEDLVAWCGGKVIRRKNNGAGRGGEFLWINIETLEGVMHASPGDWIIKGVSGEFYPCKPDIFEQTYEDA